jgi:hypothetical protein
LANERHPRASAFFTEYDRTFNLDLLAAQPLPPAERAQREADVKAVGFVLLSRLKARREGWPLSSADRAAVERLSAQQLALYRRHYPGPEHGLDLPALGEAFLRFAHGDLRDAEGSEHGQPNSANLFSFAEYAFLACALGVDAAAWGALAPLFVQLQDVYVAAYRPRDRPPEAFRFIDYGMRNFDAAGHRDLAAAEIAALLAQGRSEDPEARATANVLRAFPGGVQF